MEAPNQEREEGGIYRCTAHTLINIYNGRCFVQIAVAM